METKKICQIDDALKYIGKKWTLNIIKDLFYGYKRFNDFLKNNPDLSAKMLSERLRELEKNNIIKKAIVSTTPVKIEYSLTKKGKATNKIIYELAIFAKEYYLKDKEKISQDYCNKIKHHLNID